MPRQGSWQKLWFRKERHFQAQIDDELMNEVHDPPHRNGLDLDRSDPRVFSCAYTFKCLYPNGSDLTFDLLPPLSPSATPLSKQQTTRNWPEFSPRAVGAEQKRRRSVAQRVIEWTMRNLGALKRRKIRVIRWEG